MCPQNFGFIVPPAYIENSLIDGHCRQVFYYAHHTFLALFLAVLWHAPSAWYYIVPGLAMWVLDVVLRFCEVCRPVTVLSLGVEAGIVKMEYLVNGIPLKHTMGQFVFINVPEISLVRVFIGPQRIYAISYRGLNKQCSHSMPSVGVPPLHHFERPRRRLDLPPHPEDGRRRDVHGASGSTR